MKFDCLTLFPEMFEALNQSIIGRAKEKNLIEINLITGRPHQIRVQFSSRNHPLLGDSKYGKNSNNINIALFAKSISFIHPTTKEKLTFSLDTPNRYPFNIFK